MRAVQPGKVPEDALTWCEVDVAALHDNVRTLRRLLAPRALLAPVVKGNAYGHGLTLAARAFVEAGADWLCVQELREAEALREAGIEVPVLVLGYVPPALAPRVAAARARVVVFDRDELDALHAAGARAGWPVPVHVKVETGTHRQGLGPREALAFVERVRALRGVRLEGITTHFADVEDTTDHTFARGQLDALRAFAAACAERGHDVPLVHCANSAATLLWPHAHLGLVRVGIAAYGLWPSRETLISALAESPRTPELRPALTWKARVVQVKTVPCGGYVGYGRTYRATHDIRLAVLGAGYFDGYDRRLSNQAWVLFDGCRAPVRGRVCMNLTMVDVTDVPGVAVGDAAVLMGRSGDEAVTAEQIADWIGTIHYEVTTRIAEHVPRVASGGEQP